MIGTIGGNQRQMTAGTVQTENGGAVADAGRVSTVELLKANGIQITEELQRMIAQGEASGLEALQEIMKAFCETEKNTIDNLKPSEKSVELRRRRLEEVKKLIEECERSEAKFEQALVRFKNLLDPEDVARFDSAATENALFA